LRRRRRRKRKRKREKDRDRERKEIKEERKKSGVMAKRRTSERVPTVHPI